MFYIGVFFFGLTRVNPSDPWPDHWTGSMTGSGFKTMVISRVWKPGPVWRVDPEPGRPGAGTGPGWLKNRISHDPAGWPGKTRLQPVDFCFCFFTKTTPFWIFFKIEIDPVTRSKPGTRALDWAGFKNYGYREFF